MTIDRLRIGLAIGAAALLASSGPALSCPWDQPNCLAGKPPPPGVPSGAGPSPSVLPGSQPNLRDTMIMPKVVAPPAPGPGAPSLGAVGALPGVDSPPPAGPTPGLAEFGDAATNKPTDRAYFELLKTLDAKGYFSDDPEKFRAGFAALIGLLMDTDYAWQTKVDYFHYLQLADAELKAGVSPSAIREKMNHLLDLLGRDQEEREAKDKEKQAKEPPTEKPSDRVAAVPAAGDRLAPTYFDLLVQLDARGYFSDDPEKFRAGFAALIGRLLATDYGLQTKIDYGHYFNFVDAELKAGRSPSAIREKLNHLLDQLGRDIEEREAKDKEKEKAKAKVKEKGGAAAGRRADVQGKRRLPPGVTPELVARFIVAFMEWQADKQARTPRRSASHPAPSAPPPGANEFGGDVARPPPPAPRNQFAPGKVPAAAVKQKVVGGAPGLNQPEQPTVIDFPNLVMVIYPGRSDEGTPPPPPPVPPGAVPVTIEQVRAVANAFFTPGGAGAPPEGQTKDRPPPTPPGGNSPSAILSTAEWINVIRVAVTAYVYFAEKTVGVSRGAPSTPPPQNEDFGAPPPPPPPPPAPQNDNSGAPPEGEPTKAEIEQALKEALEAFVGFVDILDGRPPAPDRPPGNDFEAPPAPTPPPPPQTNDFEAPPAREPTKAEIEQALTDVAEEMIELSNPRDPPPPPPERPANNEFGN
ncbi:MAG: hypothetical protein HZC25_04360 [Rhodospirillales bacterium]|nr:hypothetical protein [Rhodospirillales bacterium]